jgi:uncharacterized protein (DUF608 family)
MNRRSQTRDASKKPTGSVCGTEDLSHWTRRKFLKATATVALSAAAAPARAAASSAKVTSLFPTTLPGREWVQFPALGFSGSVAGVIYRLKDTVTNGLALGGVDTGCLSLETSGLLGYCTIFNSHVPRRDLINLPLLGLAVGDKTWALCHSPGGERIGEPQEMVHVPAWLPGHLGTDQPAWKSNTYVGPELFKGYGGEWPGWFKSLGRSPYDLPAGRIACYTPTVLRWRSPITGGVRVEGGIWLARDYKRNHKWKLVKNTAVITSGTLQWGPTSAHSLGFAQGTGGAACLAFTVKEGDFIELALESPPLGDFVGVDFRISSTGDGQSWDATQDWSEASNPNGPWTWDFRPGTRPPVGSLELERAGIGIAREIHYWGHYPVLDLEFETDAPVNAGMRAWAPFLPGDVVRSMVPGIVFEMHLRNSSASAQTGTVALTFPGPTWDEAGASAFARQEIHGSFRGLMVSGQKVSYALGVMGEERLRCGGDLGTDPAAWTNLGRSLPRATPSQPGACAAADFSLGAGEQKIIRFALTWSAPTWNGGGTNWSTGGNTFTHMYAKHYAEPGATAALLAKEHTLLLKKTLAWQEVIYSDCKLPLWLRDSLINVLYMITEDGYWAQRKPPLSDWVKEEDGLFGLSESPRSCSQIECLPCSFYGSQPLVYFFPELQLSTIRGYQGYQYPDGAPPWIFGGVTCNTPPMDFACPARGYQYASNGISLAAIVDRFLLCCDAPDKRYAKEFYPMLKRNMIYTVNLRTTPEYTIGQRIISMPNNNEGLEWFEAPEPGWFGMTGHLGGLHLAQLRIVERLATQVGDTDFARQCADWIRAGAEAMEKWLWTGSYYLNYYEPETGKKSDWVFGFQLDGEWITDHHGLPSALPKDHVRSTLEKLKHCNIAVTKYGAVNYTNADGTPVRLAGINGYGTYSYFPPSALMLAMNYMYEGQVEFGLELAYKVWHNLVCIRGYTWDMPNNMRGDADTGERVYGHDYYQDMMLWSLPAAMEGKDFSAPTRPGGLVDRMLKAAKRA